MARTYHVKRAQQRYATRPVLNPDGTQKLTPKMRRGVQMTDKHGRPVFVRVTERDTSTPLPMPKCSKCGNSIAVGAPYKYTEAYHRTIIRCDACPVPDVWEYSSSLSARLAEVDHNYADLSSATCLEDLEAARDEYAAAVRELAEEKEESATNIEDGFGHETEQSTELRDISEQLASWADDIEGVDFPELPEPEDEECPECGGTGHVVNDDGEEEECAECNSTGTVELEEPTVDALNEWLEQAREALQEKFGECPV